MARTGESYQQALRHIALRSGETYQHARERITSQRERPFERDLDGFEVTVFRYFGEPAMLATWSTHGVPVAMLVGPQAIRRPLIDSKPLFWLGRRMRW